MSFFLYLSKCSETYLFEILPQDKVITRHGLHIVQELPRHLPPHVHNRLQTSTARDHVLCVQNDDVAERSQLVLTELVDEIPVRSSLFTQQWQRWFHLHVVVEPCDPAVHGLLGQAGGHIVCFDVVEVVLREDYKLVRVDVANVSAGHS